MKVGAISGDMAVKLVLGGVVLLGAGYVLWKLKNLAIGAVPLIDPTSPDNVAYHTANAVGGSLVSDPAGPGKNADGSWTVGAWIYDMTHADAVRAATGS